MNGGWLGPPIAYADVNQEIFRRLFGKIYKTIKLAIIVEDTRIQ